MQEELFRKASKAITEMLTKAVDITLANGKAKLVDYSIAAKTGTAQISNNNGGDILKIVSCILFWILSSD